VDLSRSLPLPYGLPLPWTCRELLRALLAMDGTRAADGARLLLEAATKSFPEIMAMGLAQVHVRLLPCAASILVPDLTRRGRVCVSVCLCVCTCVCAEPLKSVVGGGAECGDAVCAVQSDVCGHTDAAMDD
jgi:hypothetical protein